MKIATTRKYYGYAAGIATMVYGGMIWYFGGHVPFEQTLGYVFTLFGIHVIANK